MKTKTRDQNRRLCTFLTLPLLLGILSVPIQGCAGVMAARQPGQKDLSVLADGTPRAAVIVELGQPVWSGEKAGAKADIFAFRQGYHRATKVTRAFFHTVADVATFGLWELVGTPTELIFNGTDMKVEVTYDEKDQVKTARVLARAAPPSDKALPGLLEPLRW